MSAPSRPLVTIDDPVTIIEPHRVLLEWVEAVHRDSFQTRSQSTRLIADANYRHDQEGTTWARGHHLPDSEIVIALRAAKSLEPSGPNTSKLLDGCMAGVFDGSSVNKADLRKLLEDARKATEDAMKVTRPWWRIGR